MPTRIHAVELPASSRSPRFDAAVGAREQERAVLRRRISASRITLISAAGVVVTGAVVLTAVLAAGAAKDPYDDGNDGFEFLYGAIPVGAGVLAAIVGGAVFINSRNRLGALAEPQRRLRARPSLSAGPRGGQVGFVLDLRF